MDFISNPSSGGKREVNLDDVRRFAEANGIGQNNVFETSAKEDINVQTVFERAATFYSPANKSSPAKANGNVQIRGNTSSKKEESGCC